MYNKTLLDNLAKKHKTDKSSLHHDYCRYYEEYLEEFKNQKIILLEVGVGGDENENVGGHSLRMWYDYFPAAKIIGVDISNKKGVMNDRTRFYQISQDDRSGLTGMVASEGNPTVIIDDASHISPLTIATFEILFPTLKSGGIYIVEDLETSYWDNYGYKGNPDPESRGTIMHFLKKLTDAPNSHCFPSKFHDDFSAQIEFIHFFRQTCIIKKK